MMLYRQEIIERWRYPRHRGVIQAPDLQGERVNSFCGDEITIFLRLGPVRSQSRQGVGTADALKAHRTSNGMDEKEQKVIEVKFQGEGCALMAASADMLCEAIQGKAMEEAQEFSADDLLHLYGEPPTPGRLPCVFLAYEALQQALAALS